MCDEMTASLLSNVTNFYSFQAKWIISVKIDTLIKGSCLNVQEFSFNRSDNASFEHSRLDIWKMPIFEASRFRCFFN